MTAGLYLLSHLGVTTSTALSSLYMFVLGVGLGASMQVLVIAVQNAVSYADLGVATSGATFFRSIGGSFGTATFGAIFVSSLARNLAASLHGLSLPPGVTAASGASPAVLDRLPAAVHSAYITGYAHSLQTVFLIATPIGAAAFLLSWTLQDVPLRATTTSPDPADTLAPTARPAVRTSDQEMERALTFLLSRERRREVYQHLVAGAGFQASPRAAWLLLRAGEHPGISRRALAQYLYLTDANLEHRLTELVEAGYVQPLAGDPAESVRLTPAGQQAVGDLSRVRQEGLARVCAGWHPEHNPHLHALLTRLTHQLAASSETPDPELDAATALSPGAGPRHLGR
jgi:DNA-binding MarR family transcriptional regulator